MAYDPTKDKLLQQFGPFPLSDNEKSGNILINIYSWDNGEPKIALLHQFTNKEGETRTTKKIPRLTADVVKEVLNAMNSAITWIDNYKYAQELAQ